MPRKLKISKVGLFGKRPLKKRRRVKKSGKINRNMIVYRPMHHNPLPPIYKTKLTASASFYTGVGGTTGDYLFNFRLSTPRLPFSQATTGVTYNSIGPTTFNPPGYSILLNNNLYTNCLVDSVKFELDCCPQNTTDSMIITMTPSKTAGIPSTMANALSQPYTKQQGFAAGRTYKQGDFPFKQYIDIAKFLGISKLVYDNDIAGVYSSPVGSDPINILYMVVNAETGDNTNLASPLEFRVRITYYVKYYEFTTAALTTG